MTTSDHTSADALADKTNDALPSSGFANTVASWWTSPIVAAGLIGGYGVASTTGVRPLGGLVLLAAGGLAGWIWWQRCSKLSVAALSGVFIGAFIASHPLAKKLGAWPSVLTATAIAAAITWFVADRRK